MTPLKKFQNLLHTIFLCVFLIILVFDKTCATPQLSQQDPYVIYSANCSDKFYEKRDKMQFKFGFAPFYQQTHYARNGSGQKVPLAEMNGKWNMLAPFFDIDSLTPKTFNSTTYPNLFKSKNALQIGTVDYSQESNYDPEATSEIKTGEFTTRRSQVLFNSLKCDYEKLGLRGKIGFEFGHGFGFNVKTGVGDVKYTGTLSAAVPTDQTFQPAYDLYGALLSAPSSTGIFKEIPLDIKEVRRTSFEDTHVEFYFQAPFDCKDADETVVTIAPYFSVGGWLPTGEEKDYKKFYSLPTGNNGHYCLTIEGALNFDFPGTIQLSVGGGALLADTKEYSDFRLPTNIYQEGFYPWTTKVEEEPGTTWYFNASFKAENFVPDLSFAFDYVYSYHEKDDITIKEPSSNANAIKRRATFESMKENYIDQTEWKDQRFNAGLSYKIVNHLSIGCAIQAHFSGIRVFKTTTEMAYIDLTF